MKPTELIQRISAGENIHTEFKKQILRNDDLAASIVAFANTDGGQIIIGVDDKGTIIGLKNVEKLMQAIDNIALNNCEPPLSLLQESIPDKSGKEVLVVNIARGDQRPYRTNRGIHYIRTTTGKQQASRQQLLRLFQSSESLYYDESPIFHSKLTDLDDGAIDRLLDQVKDYGADIAAIPKARILLNWRLAREINNEKYPTLAGILLLSRRPQEIISYAYVSALRIPGTDISIEPSDQKHLDGRLDEVLHDTMRFLDIHLMRPHRIRKLEPEAKFELPVEVLREALVNALVHRDYTISAPVRVIVFDNRIEIRTPGHLPNTLTLESLPLGVHVLRNPTIYNMFLKMGFVTDAGSGIPRMIRVLQTETGKEPSFHIEGNEYIVRIPRSQATE